MLQNMLRAATARGTRRHGYFAAAVAARDRVRPLWPPSCESSYQCRTSFCSLSLYLFFSLCLTLSFRLSFALSFPLSLYLLHVPLPPVLRLCRFLSIRSRLFYPSPRYRSRGLTGMRRSGVASPSPTHLHVYLLSYTHTRYMHTLARLGRRKHF